MNPVTAADVLYTMVSSFAALSLAVAAFFLTRFVKSVFELEQSISWHNTRITILEHELKLPTPQRAD